MTQNDLQMQLEHMQRTLVQVINFAMAKRGNIHGKAWIFPRRSVFFSWKQFRRNRDDPQFAKQFYVIEENYVIFYAKIVIDDQVGSRIN